MNQIPETLPDLAYSPKWQRVVHVLLDTSLAGFLALALVKGVLLFPYSHTFAVLVLGAVNARWFAFFFMLPYYLLFEVGFRTTPAKFFTGSIVTDAEGGVPTRKQFLKRTLLRFIPLEPLSFFDRDGKGWHDAGSKTYVVRRSSVKRGFQATA